jgi:formylglycine-generating enzyme required for sulfatase activity
MKVIKGSSRIIRGGSWHSYDSLCSVSHRGNSFPGGRYFFMGFRIAIGGVI